METRQYWEENGHAVKYENYNSNDGFPPRGCGEQLNFATAPSEDEADYPPGAAYIKKGKVSRQDPMSHRIIEKRRRDRMNNCLADLSRLIPPEYLKKGRGRVEKTEIIEMAIRHLKYLQDRVNGLYQDAIGRPDYVSERMNGSSAEPYRCGYQEASGEAVRFLVEVQGYGPGDSLCVQLASHLQRHCDNLVKLEPFPHKATRHGCSSSETASSSGSSHGFPVKVIARADPAPDHYDNTDHNLAMDCDRACPGGEGGERGEVLEPAGGGAGAGGGGGAGARGGAEGEAECRRRDATLRAVRKPDHSDYLHSYKFKNSIERRFSRSQDCEAHDMSVRAASHGPKYGHKRRRGVARAPPPHPASHPSHPAPHPAHPAHVSSASTSGSTEDARDTSPQDTSSESPHHHYEKPPLPNQYVPVFALNALGKYYVPLSVEQSCVSRAVETAGLESLGGPLHPVTIHVNFQPCRAYHRLLAPHHHDREHDRDWGPI